MKKKVTLEQNRVVYTKRVMKKQPTKTLKKDKRSLELFLNIESNKKLKYFKQMKEVALKTIKKIDEVITERRLDNK